MAAVTFSLNVDPDDQDFFVANVTADLASRATTAVSVETITNGVTVLIAPEIQGNLIVFKCTITQLEGVPVVDKPSITLRVTCASGARFDRTIHFNLEDH